ncbi:MAG: hypothetical protein QM750_30610 [Rubrivivax sp.]
MALSALLRILLLFLAFALSGCSAQRLERDFFRGDLSTRNQRLAGYTMEEQWQIYLYGNQVIHPPATGLAEVLARGHEPMLRFILRRLESTRNDLDYRDSMVVFQTMQWHGDYSICGDEAAFSKIKSNQYRIENADWQRVYGEMLQELCRSK